MGCSCSQNNSGFTVGLTEHAQELTFENKDKLPTMVAPRIPEADAVEGFRPPQRLGCSCSQSEDGNVVGLTERAQELILEKREVLPTIVAPPLSEAHALPSVFDVAPPQPVKADSALPEAFKSPRQVKMETMSLKVSPATSIGDCEQDDIPILVRVQTPDAAERVPSCFCCVLDVSTSMGAEAKIVGTSGSVESHGLSLLDVAKHGVRTIANILGEKDKLAIVTFNHKSSLLMGVTVMDEAGKKAAAAFLDTARAEGGTDIWEGLRAGLDILRPLTNDRVCHLMLLSDGESSFRDEIVPNLDKYREQYGDFRGSINTFGFGYNIDSELLSDLAAHGDGSYGFIPDPGFIGTAFVNTISNLLATCARGATLFLETEGDCVVLEVLGGHEVAVDEESSALIVKLGMLQYEQPKDVVLRMNIKGAGQYLRVSGQYEPLNIVGIPIVPFDVVQGSTAGSTEVAPQLIRCKLVDALNAPFKLGVFNKTQSMESVHSTAYFKRVRSTASAGSSPSVASGFNPADASPSLGSSPSTNAPMEQSPSLFARFSKRLSGLGITSEKLAKPNTNPMTHVNSAFTSQTSIASATSRRRIDREEALRIAKQAVEDLSHDISAELSNSDPLIKGICEDIAGQMAEAVSCKEYFVKWGRHYLPSLMFAHKLQQCNNFKDPGVQFYGGELFNELRDMADDIFNQLPPPEPSVRPILMFGQTLNTSQPAAPISMAAYNDRYAG